MDYDYSFKIVVVGDSGVGKSALMLRFADNAFSENFMPTIGVDFKVRTMLIDANDVKLSIWDTAGHERFRTLTTSFYRGAHAVVIVYDVSNPESFNNVSRHLQDVNRYTFESTPVLLIGNKSDLGSARRISFQEGQQRALELGLNFMETSAKDSTNVETCFSHLATKLLQRVGEH